MHKEPQTESPTEEKSQLKPKPKEEDTLFDRRVKWIKNHKFFSWVLLIAFGSGVIGGVWGLLPGPVKDVVNDKLTTVASSDAENSDRVKAIIQITTRPLKAVSSRRPIILQLTSTSIFWSLI